MRIYLIFDHDEDGPGRMAADTDPAAFRALALAWIREHYWPFSPPSFGPDWDQIEANVDRAIAAAGRSGENERVDGYGWGGPTIRVIEATGG